MFFGLTGMLAILLIMGLQFVCVWVVCQASFFVFVGGSRLLNWKELGKFLAFLCFWGAIHFGVIYKTKLFGQEIPIQSGPLGVRPTAKQIELGHKLFFDPRLSQNNTISCATCHNPRKGWADGLELAVGINGGVGNRHSPTILNASYVPLVFWDGRVGTIVPQALLPLSNRLEMGVQSEDDVVRKLRLIPGYVRLFSEAFGTEGVDVATLSPVSGPNLARAISSFETTIVSFNAPIDRRLAGDLKALTPDAEIGFRLFESANCMSCHKPPLFTDNLFHNNGMEYAGKVQVTDLGRAGILPASQRNETNIRAFKTPTLREIDRTAPYNHAGNFPDLRRVLIHYRNGGEKSDGTFDRYLDARVRLIAAMQMTDMQMRYLEKFLREAFRGKHYPMIEEPTLP